MNAQGDQWDCARGSVNAQRARRGCGCIPANALPANAQVVGFGVNGL